MYYDVVIKNGVNSGKLFVLSSSNLKEYFNLNTEGNVKQIEIIDINNDGKNELIFSTENNFINIVDSNSKEIYEYQLLDEIIKFNFLDSDKDGFIDIIVATSRGIIAINKNGEEIWKNFVKMPFIINFLIKDIDNFAEKEIVGYTYQSVFILKYNGGSPKIINFDFPIKAFSICDTSIENLIVIALSNKDLYWMDYKGNKNIILNTEIKVTRIIPSTYGTKYFKRNFLFILYDDKKIDAIDTSGKKVDNLNDYENVLDLTHIDYEKDDILLNYDHFNEFILSKDDSGILIFAHYGRDTESANYDKGWIKLLEYSGNQEKIVFSKVINDSQNHFILIQVSEKGKIYIYNVMKDIEDFFSLCNNGIIHYQRKEYRNAFSSFNSIFNNKMYNDLKEKYQLDQINTFYSECKNHFNIIEEEATQNLIDGLELTSDNPYDALWYLQMAYIKFENANFNDNDVVFEEQNLKLNDIEYKIFELLFPLLEKANERYTKSEYEEAFVLFSRIYYAYDKFRSNIKIYIEKDLFKKYSPLVDLYPSAFNIKTIIDSSKDIINNEAEKFYMEGNYKEAKNLYESLKTGLLNLGEIEESDMIKEINEKIEYCDIGIKKSNIKLMVFLSFIGFPLILFSFYLNKFFKFSNDDFNKYIQRVKSRKAWDNWLINLASFSGGFIVFLMLKQNIDFGISLVGFLSSFSQIILVLIFFDFVLNYIDITKEPLSFLLQRIKDGENETLEFKSEWTEPIKIAKVMTAFANTNGGSILFGIGNNREIFGVSKKNEDLEKLKQQILNCGSYNIKPALTPKIIDHIMVDGKLVIEVVIEEYLQEINMDSDNKIWIRKHSHCYTSDPEELRELYQKID